MDKKLKFKENPFKKAASIDTDSPELLHLGRGSVGTVIKATAKPVVSFFLSYIISGATPALGVYPFGPAMLCAVSSFYSAIAVLLGCIGASFGMGSFAVPYVIISVCVFTLRLALGGFGLVKTLPSEAGKARERAKLRDSPHVQRGTVFCASEAFSTAVGVKVLCAAGAAAAAGIYNILSGTNLWYDIFGLAFGCILAPLLTFAFSSVIDGQVHPTMRKTGVGALAYALIFSVSSFTLGGMNVSVVLAFSMSLFVAYSCGAEDAALFGVFMGIALEPQFCAMYSIAGVCAAILFPISAGAALFCAASLSLSWALYADGISAISSALPEIMLASLLFYPVIHLKLLPERIDLFAAGGNAAISSDEAVLSVEKGKNVKERIDGICNALSYMSNVFQNLSKRLRAPGNAETFAICEEAFGSACATCAKKTICHQREGFGSGEVIRSFSRQLKESGNLNSLFVPDSMLRGCPNIDEIISSVNREYNKLFEYYLKFDKTAVIATDYGALATLIRESVAKGEREYDKNEKATEALKKCFDSESITYEALSVYGFLRPQIFVRGVTVKNLSYGAADLRELAEEATGFSLSEPEMSIDYDKLNIFFDCRKKYKIIRSAFSLPASDSEANGDTVTSFTVEDSVFHMLLCDGMGSGRDAALTSRISSVFLERMLCGGSTDEAALVLLNNFTKERRIECFSTVDMLSVDLFSGKARFIKSGAAPSFVLRNGKLFRLECESTPIGILKELSAKAVDFELKSGDIVIMLSDGVIQDEESSAWLYDMLGAVHIEKDSLTQTARQIATASRQYSKRPDDTTVGIVKIESAA